MELIKDICEIIAPKNIYNELRQKKILDIKEQTKKNYLISVLDVIKLIKNKYPEHYVINLGEKDIIIEYLPKIITPNKFLLVLKIIFVLRIKIEIKKGINM